MSQARTAPPVSRVRELRLERLLGRRVLARNGESIGRLEEFRAEKHGTGYVITEFVIGLAGVVERLGSGMRVLLGQPIASGYVAHWDQIDFTDPDCPRLTCRVEQLRRADA